MTLHQMVNFLILFNWTKNLVYKAYRPILVASNHNFAFKAYDSQFKKPSIKLFIRTMPLENPENPFRGSNVVTPQMLKSPVSGWFSSHLDVEILNLRINWLVLKFWIRNHVIFTLYEG